MTGPGPAALLRAGRVGLSAGLLVVSGMASGSTNDTAPAALLDFSAAEQSAIQRHGPWPPPPAHDAGNRWSGRPAAIVLGRQLFLDARLSPDARLACASCHDPAQDFSDGRRQPPGRDGVPLQRNSPSLWNAGQQRWLGWDGAFDSLWSQALHPLLAPQEMASSAAQLDTLLATDRNLARRWRQAFAGTAAHTPEARLVLAAKALGAFVATLVSARTPFDDFRDALARGDASAAARYPLAAQRGLRLFIGSAGCNTCHVGPLFSNGEFADIGLPFFVRPGVVGSGRHGGIAALRASPYNLLSRWRDAGPPATAGAAAPPADAATKTRHLAPQHRNFGEFKVPSLRNLAGTAPYMHDGQLPTLAAVVQHYSALDTDRLHADGEQILKPLQLHAGDQADLVAFLHSLSPVDGNRPPPPQRQGHGRDATPTMPHGQHAHQPPAVPARLPLVTGVVQGASAARLVRRPPA